MGGSEQPRREPEPGVNGTRRRVTPPTAPRQSGGLEPGEREPDFKGAGERKGPRCESEPKRAPPTKFKIARCFHWQNRGRNGVRSAPTGTPPLDEKRLSVEDITVLSKGRPVRRLSAHGPRSWVVLLLPTVAATAVANPRRPCRIPSTRGAMTRRATVGPTRADAVLRPAAPIPWLHAPITPRRTRPPWSGGPRKHELRLPGRKAACRASLVARACRALRDPATVQGDRG